MSKSLGNFLMIKDILKKYHPEALRLFLLSNHYRSPIDYSEKAMEEASSGLDKIYKLLKRIEEKTEIALDGKAYGPGTCWKQFCEAMDDDFNSAKGIGVLFETIHNLNRLLDQYENDFPPDILNKIGTDRADVLKAGRILGLAYEAREMYFTVKKSKGLSNASIDPEMINRLIAERAAARQSKNWEKADQIRQQLTDMNIVLQDRPDGSTDWEINS